ncbi:6-phospho-beta-glucosidase [Enterococcus termitis]|uniref:6-phospho-beta-glucosidase n=1 Tax=Enterococcus termitis TaxID=332950 RepID=A0A1E5GAN2_9ENTE|nr:6-phospho-beta-glucosidase [Enterococcus termitis]OEG09776.1 6-phospho-beta-glucosidase [Enterococcus termitis]OJG96905.1 diacetylchitobiose-6-phosphate hydrolase [Enterococcus termitis]
MSKQALKIVTIGGGSSYTPEIIEGFIQKKLDGLLPIKEIHLVDIEAGKEKLEIVGGLAKRMVEKAGAEIEIHLTLDRKAALEGAAFVTTQFRVGLLPARIRDEKIPLKYDLIGQETNGAGGAMKALRTIPVILDICKDMEELCPDAWLINFTNPSGIITETVLKHSSIKVVGLCNIPIGIVNKIAKLYETDAANVSVEFSGLNHFVFGKNIYVNGKEVTREVIEKIKDGTEISAKNIPNFSFPADVLDAIGMIPAGYLKYYYTREKMLADCKRAAAEEGTRGEVVTQTEKELFELYKDKELAIKPKQLEERGGAHYSEAAVNLIDSIYNGDGKIHYVNVRNNGTLPELPDNTAIECNCVVTHRGALPVTVGKLETSIRGQISLMKAYEELVIEAGVTGDYAAALKALTINPLVNDSDKARAVLQDMLWANQDYLPQFSEWFEKNPVK